MAHMAARVTHDYEGESDEAPRERWAPIGAAASPSTSLPTEKHGANPSSLPDHELCSLRDENDQMTNSLLSLTSHFAQVQFRLKQIVSGPADQMQQRLAELEEFAQKGIPDIKSCVLSLTCTPNAEIDEEYQKKLSEKQKSMINDLRSQLSDLEHYAYESGLADDIPTETKMEKQEIIIEEVRKKLQIANLDDLATLSSEDLRDIVDDAVAQIVNPAKVKDKQLEQLKTQVVDLERFVDFLQAEATSQNKLGKELHALRGDITQHSDVESRSYSPFGLVRTQGTGSSVKEAVENVPEPPVSRLKRIISVLHLFIISELGCASRSVEKRNTMKKTTRQPHYGDLLAEMHMSVDRLVDVAEQCKIDTEESTFGDCDYLSDEETYISENRALTECVRKYFAASLRKLIEHGMGRQSLSRALVPFGCISGRSPVVTSDMPKHAWHVVLKYYELKNGKEFNEMPARRLADSFGMEAINGAPVTVKQTLLSGIGHIIETHSAYKRSEDAHFKAFVCLALNQKKLVAWLRQIFHTSAIIDNLYEPWSYVRKTKFEDSFCLMNKLKLFEFNLPVDLAVKQLSNIKDAF